jgi:hypothetical protein
VAISTLDEAVAAVRRLCKKLDPQAADADKWRRYYEGEQPLKFASNEWREWFSAQYEGFSDNWCASVVDATAERQRWTGFRLYGAKKADQDLGRVMRTNGADIDFGLAATEAQYARRAFMTVWGNPDDESTPVVDFESPTQMVLEYEPGSRRKRRAALKRWTDEDGVTHATLYAPDFIWKFTQGSALFLPSSLGLDWRPRLSGDEPWPLPNPLGVVPVVEIANRTTLIGAPLSAISGVAAMQDAINLIWSHLFTASDFAALPQRVILGAELPKIPVLDENGQKIGEKVIDLPEANIKRIMNLEGPNAKIAEWSPAKFDGFLDVITTGVNHIANQTRTPAYYMMGGTTFANIGAEAIKALDAGLVQKVKNLNDVQSDPMREGAVLILKAQGEDEKAKAMAAGSTEFADIEIRSDAQLADSLTKYASIGFPFEWLAKQKISDPDELKWVIEKWEKQQADPTMERIARDLGSSLTGAVDGDTSGDPGSGGSAV